MKHTKKRVIVPNVRIAKGVAQRVTFMFNRKNGRYVVHTKGFPRIQIKPGDDGKFHVNDGDVNIKAKRPEVVFSRAVKKIWSPWA